MLGSCSGSDVVPSISGTMTQRDSIVALGLGSMANMEWIEVPRHAATRAEVTPVKTIPTAFEPTEIGAYGFVYAPSTDFETQLIVFSNERMLKRSELTGNGLYTGSNAPPYWATSDYIDNWPSWNDWLYFPEKYWRRTRYKFYAYSPYRNNDTEAKASSFAGFTNFEWRNIPEFNAYDYMVSNRILLCDNTTGTYGYITNPDKTLTEKQTPQVSLSHILARIRFCFKEGQEYAKLRHIHLKSMTVQRATHYYTYNAIFEQENQPITREVWTLPPDAPAATEQTHNLQPEYQAYAEYTGDSHEGMLLPTTKYMPFASLYVVPHTSTSGSPLTGLRVTVTYDVYDLTGQITRKDCEVSNTLSLNWNMRRGCYYDAHLEIEPDFLYVLSDNDFDEDCDGWFSTKN